MNTKITIEFIAPSILNELKGGDSPSKTLWSYAGIENSALVLDTTNWCISCEANNSYESIEKWSINEASCTMKVRTSEDEDPDFKTLDYPFAVSMIGQMCNTGELILYLRSLQEIYNSQKQND